MPSRCLRWPIAAVLPLCWLALYGAAQAQPAESILVQAARRDPAAGSTLLDAAQIEASGDATLGSLLGQMPAFGGQGVNDAQDDNGFGEAFVDLRNLNFNRTLVLLDGSRFVLSGIQTDEAVDLNIIPSAFVDRIAVQADGTHPATAADAVAGLVDVRLKRDLDGVQLTSYGGAAAAGDAGTAGISVVAGQAIAGGHLTIGLDWLKRDPIRQSDRDWAANPITGFEGSRALIGSTATPGGHAVGDGIDSLALGGDATRAFDPATDQYNFAGGRYLQGGLQRASAMVSADHAVGSMMTVRVGLLYTDRDATTLLPPQTLGLNGTDKHPDGFVVPATDASNPFGAPVTLERVVSEAGPQLTTTSGPVWRVTAGLTGAAGPWSWEVSVDHGQSLSRYVTTNAINLTRALQTVGDGPCAAGCVAADWFGPGSLSAAALDYVRYTARSQSSYGETVGMVSVSRSLFGLPGGPARLTLGGEARAESGRTSVDSVTAAGDQAGDDAAPTAGSYTTQDGFVSLDLPLLRHFSWADLAELQLDARATRTSRYGSFATLRAGVTYAPVAGLTLHAASGTARRPPAIAEAFGGVTDLDLPVTDPCDSRAGLRADPVVDRNCQAVGLGAGFVQASPVIDVASGGNPSLRPERSENETVGAALRPPGWPFVTVSLDWWRYRLTDAIDSLEDTNPDLIPDACYQSVGLSSPLCALLSRIPGGGNAGQISRILGLDENVGTIKTSGFDADAAFDRELAGIGRLTADWQTTWLLDYRLHTFGQSGFTQYAGTFPGLNGVGLYARVRSRGSIGIARGDWSLGWTGRFISGGRVLDTTVADPDTRAAPLLYQDIDVSRRIGRVIVMAGVQNLADTPPPTLLDGETNTDTATYDVVGRFIWLRLRCLL
jgi:iron complex outermembrane receptor protein